MLIHVMAVISFTNCSYLAIELGVAPRPMFYSNVLDRRSSHSSDVGAEPLQAHTALCKHSDKDNALRGSSAFLSLLIRHRKEN